MKMGPNKTRITLHRTKDSLSLWHFLQSEMATYPGQVNTVIRCLLSSTIVIVTSMTLQIPWLTLSLIVVFFVTQSNIVITRLIGALFILGVNVAIAAAILLLKFTFDYPLIRISVACVLFFCCVYLMRITKIGVVFFIIGIVIIYVQSFVDLMYQGESLVRMVLWVWVATNYAIVTTLLINTLFFPTEPAQQLKAEMHRQIRKVIAILAMKARKNSARFKNNEQTMQRTMFPLHKLVRVSRMRNASYRKQQVIQRDALTLQKLLRLTVMRNEEYRQHKAKYLASIATISRLYGEANHLLAYRSVGDTKALNDLRMICRTLDKRILAGQILSFSVPQNFYAFDTSKLPTPAAEMLHALQALSDHLYATTPAATTKQENAIRLKDATGNPVYVQFALKTLLAVFISYLFYNAAQWQGAHTVMLTSLIVAQPSLGATKERGMLRIIGASIGSAWALCSVVFILPHLDSIVGLLLVSLPALALGAWVTTGSERISYAGIQIMFTFALSVLSDFGPVTDLTEIRDRLIGIFLGVGISMFIHTTLWPESESGVLRRNIAGVLHTMAKLLRTPVGELNSEERLMQSQYYADTLTELSVCEATLARTALEPSWQPSEIEGSHTRIVLQAQAVLAQTRELFIAVNAFQGELASQAKHIHKAFLDAAMVLQSEAASRLDRYAEDMTTEPLALSAIPLISLKNMQQLCANNTDRDAPQNKVLSSARILAENLSVLPGWTATSTRSPSFREATI